MARKRKRESGGGASWMETYSDLVTLLLTFFILLFSMSTMDNEKYKILVQAFSKVSPVEAPEESKMEDIGEVPDETKMEELDMDKLYQLLKEYVSDSGLSGSVEVSKSEEYVFIRFYDDITFSGYSNKLNDKGKQVLDVLADGMKLVDEYIEEVIIAGHTAEVVTDNTKRDRSLSTERANSVLEYLERKAVISPAKYLAIGYGLYSPIADNSTPEGRAKNRRVEIYISRKGYPVSYTNIIKETINTDNNKPAEGSAAPNDTTSSGSDTNGINDSDYIKSRVVD